MLKKVGLALIGLVSLGLLVLFGLAASQPDEIFVERQTSIAAPPPVVFGHINDLHRFTEWSPWQKRDPAMQTSFEGPDAGAGAVYAWQGNREVGSGRITITDAIPSSKIEMRLDFTEPFVATDHVLFKLTPTPEGTRVSWAMTGTNDFTSKVVSVFIDMDKMLGRDFESGLAELKRLAEGG